MKQIFKAKPDVAIGSDRSAQRYLAGGNLEITLTRDYHVDLNHNAAFELLYTREGRSILKHYHELYLQLAERYQLTYILETPTWRANRDWIYRLGYNAEETSNVNRQAVEFIREIQIAKDCDVIVSGTVGPRRDAFDPTSVMSADESAQYHSEQVRTFALLDVDNITARAFNDSNEAIGVVMACCALGVPVIISFKVDEKGVLASGEPLGEAIARVDQETRLYATYYTLHCVSAETLDQLIHQPGYWTNRLHGILNIAKDPAFEPSAIKEHFPNLKIVGGCGFDFSTLDELCRQFTAQ